MIKKLLTAKISKCHFLHLYSYACTALMTSINSRLPKSISCILNALEMSSLECLLGGSEVPIYLTFKHKYEVS